MKKTTPNKDSLIQVRVSDEQKAALRVAADRDGLSLSTWLRVIGLRESGGYAREAGWASKRFDRT
jgi:hypothetical protein